MFAWRAGIWAVRAGAGGTVPAVAVQAYSWWIPALITTSNAVTEYFPAVIIVVIFCRIYTSLVVILAVLLAAVLPFSIRGTVFRIIRLAIIP